MPEILNFTQDNTQIELDEFVQIIHDKKFDFQKKEDIIASAKYFNRLNNNKSFLTDFICNELNEITDGFQKSNFYGPQVFMVHSEATFFIRAVVWNPITSLEASIKDFKYDICHDHNFDILTAGYLGPGYKSRCYTYNLNETVGKLEETVLLKDEGIYQLNEGKVMLYRGKKDIHIQLPPETTSVSLNLIPRNEKVELPQFQFDESTHKICRYLHSSGKELVARMAGALGDENALPLLEQLFKSSDNTFVKAHAANSIVQISTGSKDKINHEIDKAGNPVLQDIFERENRHYGNTLQLIN